MLHFAGAPYLRAPTQQSLHSYVEYLPFFHLGREGVLATMTGTIACTTWRRRYATREFMCNSIALVIGQNFSCCSRVQISQWEAWYLVQLVAWRSHARRMRGETMYSRNNRSLQLFQPSFSFCAWRKQTRLTRTESQASQHSPICKKSKAQSGLSSSQHFP